MDTFSNLTFVIFTYNEEKRIEYVIRNFISYGKVIVIDNCSIDNTRGIAESLGAKVYEYKNPGYVETQEELDFVRTKVDTDYMTWSFSDHIWAKELLDETIKITREGIYDGISTIQKNYNYGIEDLNFSTFHILGKKKSQHVRVFRKELLYCEGMIHGSLKNKCNNIYYMPFLDRYYIHHLSLYDVNKFELGHNRYSTIEAKMRFDAGEKISFMKLLTKVVGTFMKYYFIDGAWRNGKPGLIMVLQYTFFTFNIGAKQWELENDMNLYTIENSYNVIREKYLKEIELKSHNV